MSTSQGKSIVHKSNSSHKRNVQVYQNGPQRSLMARFNQGIHHRIRSLIASSSAIKLSFVEERQTVVEKAVEWRLHKRLEDAGAPRSNASYPSEKGNHFLSPQYERSTRLINVQKLYNMAGLLKKPFKLALVQLAIGTFPPITYSFKCPLGPATSYCHSKNAYPL